MWLRKSFPKSREAAHHAVTYWRETVQALLHFSCCGEAPNAGQTAYRCLARFHVFADLDVWFGWAWLGVFSGFGVLGSVTHAAPAHSLHSRALKIMPGAWQIPAIINYVLSSPLQRKAAIRYLQAQ